MRLYLDAAPLIYLVEDVPGYGSAVEQRCSEPKTVIITSSLTRLECRVKPLQTNDRDLLGEYDTFFTEAIAEAVRLTEEVIDRATEIRAHYRFRTPDALHLAAAVEANCDVFLTNDQRLERFADVAVETIQTQ